MTVRSRPTDAPLDIHYLSGGARVTDPHTGLVRYLNELEGRLDDVVEQGTSAAVVEALVATGGSDTLGDGTLANPYATIERALRDAPRELVSGGAFRVRVVAPYTGPGFQWNMNFASVVPASGAASAPAVIEAYYDSTNPNYGSATLDPRWTILKGPLTATGATTEHGRPLYTFGVGTFPVADEDVGRTVRVFSSGGVEKFRGVVAFQRGAGTEQLVVHTRTGFSAPAIGDVVYIVKPAVRITEACTIGGVAPRNGLWLVNVELGQSLSLQHVGTANINGLEVRRVDGSVTQAVSVTGMLAALSSPGAAASTVVGLGNLYPATEAALIQSHVASIYNSHASGRSIFWSSADLLTAGFLVRGQLILTRGNFCQTGGTAALVSRRGGLLLEHSWVNFISVSSQHPVFTDCATVIDAGGGATLSGGSGHSIVVDVASVTGRALFARQSYMLDSGAGVPLKFIPMGASTTLATVVVEGKQFCSLLIDSTSTLLGTGGDAKAGDSAAVSWATLATTPQTDTTRLATVRATA